MRISHSIDHFIVNNLMNAQKAAEHKEEGRDGRESKEANMSERVFSAAPVISVLRILFLVSIH